MKKRATFILISLIVLLFIASISPAASSYVGNKKSKKLHNLAHASCQNYVNMMNEENKVYFNSEQEGINAGYFPCDACPTNNNSPSQEMVSTSLTIKAENDLSNIDKVIVSGKLTYTSYGYNFGLYSKNVTINRLSDNQTVTTLVTDIIGDYSYTFIPTQTASYQANFAGDSSYSASTSPQIIIKETSKLSITVKPKAIKLRKSVIIKGQLKDSKNHGLSGRKITIKGNNKNIKIIKTNKRGEFSFKHKPKKTTTYKNVFNGDENFRSTNSKQIRVKIIK